eukprot:2335282-Prymnesium_polylepis.1
MVGMVHEIQLQKLMASKGGKATWSGMIAYLLGQPLKGSAAHTSVTPRWRSARKREQEHTCGQGAGNVGHQAHRRRNGQGRHAPGRHPAGVRVQRVLRVRGPDEAANQQPGRERHTGR